MIYRTQWTPPGHVFPRWHDFAYAEAAEHLAGILRELGHHHVSTHHLDATETTEKR